MKNGKNDIHEATPESRRYAIYARTAAGGLEQIEAQVETATATIAHDGDGEGIVIKEYVDMDVAGAGAGASGPGLSALLRDAAAGLFDVLVITDLDRLSRSATRAHQILGAIEARGTRVILANFQ
jgi:DNA invertase Pin-like site-specific DNA recombinase